MEQFLLPLVHRAQSDLADLVVPHRGRRPGHRSQPSGPCPKQAGHRHPVQVAARRDRGGVEVGMGIEPGTRTFFPAARQWRTTAEIDPTARQWSPPSVIGRRSPPTRRTRRHEGLVPRDDLGQVTVAVDRRKHRVVRAGEVAAVDDVVAEVLQGPLDTGDPQGARPETCPMTLAPMSVGAPMMTDRLQKVTLSLIWAAARDRSCRGQH